LKKLHISDDLSLPLDFVTQTQAILAKRGVGKSYTASVEAEELLKAGQQVVVIDPTGAWFGLKSSADGKSAGFPIAVFGGEHDDVPLEEHAGEVIAQAIVERRFSAILDLSLFRKGQVCRFMWPFLETLYRQNREAMHLIVDEADAIAPQKPFGEEARMLGAMEDVVRRGRRRGIGCTLITQRPQVLNKNVLTQCEIVCCLRLIHPKDIDALEEWVNVHGDPDRAKEMIASLPALPVGTAWFWAPGWGDIFQQVHIRKRETFDSSATPKAGETQRTPKVLAPIDIAQLGQQISATVQRAKENDPAQLKRKIAELQKQVASQKPAAPVVEEKIVEVPVLKDEQIKLLTDALSEIGEQQSFLAGIASEIRSAIQMAHKRAPSPIVRPTQQQSKPLVIRDEKMRYTTTEPHHGDVSGSNGKLRDGARRMLAALCQFYPNSMPEGRLRSHAGLKKSGTYSTYKGDLFRCGYVERRGAELAATQTGMDYFGGDIPQAPASTEEVLNIWSPKLRDGARRMLERLIAHRGRFIPKEQLYEESELTVRGTAQTYLGDLKRAQLAIVRGREVAANSETLFLESA